MNVIYILVKNVALLGNAVSLQVLVGELGHFASTRGAVDEALFHKIWLIHFLDGAGVFAHRHSNSVEPNGTALKLVDDGEQNFIVDFVESVFVDVQCLKRIAGNGGVDFTGALHLGEVAHTAQQRVGDTGRTA